MEAVGYCDDAIEPIHAVKSIRHRKHDDRQQEDQIEEDFAAAAFRREGEPPMMAEPKHAGSAMTVVRRHPQGLSRPARSRTCWPSADHRRAASSQRRRWCCSMPPIGAFRNDRSASTSLPLHPPDTRPRHAFSCCQRFWNDHQSTSVAIGLGSHVQSGGHKRTLSSVTPRPTLTLSARNGQSGSTGSNLRSWMQMRAEVKSKKMTPYQSKCSAGARRDEALLPDTDPRWSRSCPAWGCLHQLCE